MRARTLDGVFVNRRGEPATDGRYEKILASSADDEIDGPRHNGEIFATPDGYRASRTVAPSFWRNSRTAGDSGHCEPRTLANDAGSPPTALTAATL